MDNKVDIACAADLCADVVLRGNVRPRFQQVEQWIGDYTIHPGGSATIFAAQAAKLGASVGMVGALGADLLGDLVRRELHKMNLDLRWVRLDPRLKTGAGFILAEKEDRAILTYSGSIDGVAPQDLTDELAAACRHWHVASPFLMTRLRETWPQWLTTLRRHGVTVSLDTNWDPHQRWEGVLPLLPLVNVFLPNQAEALAISQKTDVAAAGRALAAHGPLVVVKRGAAGAMAFRGPDCWEQPVDRQWLTAPLVDTIGAGDSFDAGFVRSWQLGWPVDRCLAMAVRCGCANVTAAGGFDGQMRENPAMILCLCPNPSVDTLVTVEDLSPGRVHRALAEECFPGGKGTHVALAAAELGCPVILAGIWAGPTGQWIRRQCEQAGIRCAGPEVPGWSRRCITFKSHGIYNETELLGCGPQVTANDVDALRASLAELADKAAVVTFSGSWPAGAPADSYNRLLDATAAKPLIVDCTGEVLAQLLPRRPAVVHLNHREASAHTGAADAPAAARALAAHCRLAVVTAGAAGAYFCSGAQVLHASCRITAQHSAVGSGDCLVAGLAAAEERRLPLAEAAALATACGAANCLRRELGMLYRRDVAALLLEVTIEEIP